MIWTAPPNQVGRICQTNLDVACFQHRYAPEKANSDSSPNERHLSKLGFGEVTIRTAKRSRFWPVRRPLPCQSPLWRVSARVSRAGAPARVRRPQFGQHPAVLETWFSPTRSAHVESVAYPVQFLECLANLDSRPNEPSPKNGQLHPVPGSLEMSTRRAAQELES